MADRNNNHTKDIANQDFRFFFELVLKYARDENLAIKLVESLVEYPHLTNYFEGHDFKKAFVNLLMSLDLDSEHAASETLKKLDDLTGVNIMTLREQWKQEGMQQGMQQGALESKKETALNLSRMGLSDDKIVEATGLEKSVIEELKKTALKKTQH